MLRVTIACLDGDALYLAVTRIITTFDLRDGNGRLKNMLDTKKHMPPRILINCVVRAPGCPPIMAEIQVYLASIKKLADEQHHYYEIRRANELAELIAENEAASKKPEAAAEPEAVPPSPAPQEEASAAAAVEERPSAPAAACSLFCDV